jgi:hypothetical protein
MACYTALDGDRIVLNLEVAAEMARHGPGSTVDVTEPYSRSRRPRRPEATQGS